MIHEKNYLIFLILLVSISIIILFFPNKNISERLTNIVLPDITMDGKINIQENKVTFTKPVQNGRLFGFICSENAKKSDCGVIIDTGSQFFFYKVNQCNKNQKITKYNYGIGSLTFQKTNQNIKYYNNNIPKYLKNINIGNICQTYGGGLTNIMGINSFSGIPSYLPTPFIDQVNKRFIYWCTYPKNGNNNYANIGFTSNMPNIPTYIKNNVQVLEIKTIGNGGWVTFNKNSLKIGDNLLPPGVLLFDTGTTYGIGIHFPKNMSKGTRYFVINNILLSINGKDINIKGDQGMIIQTTNGENPIYILGLPVLLQMMHGMVYDKKEGKLYMWARKDVIQNNYDSTNRTTTTTKMPVTTTKMPVTTTKMSVTTTTTKMPVTTTTTKMPVTTTTTKMPVTTTTTRIPVINNKNKK